jgi:TRAP-type C4-dicarboxylate transport system substrate-binding protein
MNFRALVAAVAAILAVVAPFGAAAQVELRFASTVPAPAVQNKLIFDPWIEQVNRDAKGSIRITNTFNAMANVGTVYDNVVAGVVDIGWVLHGFTPGKFPRSSVVQLPFETSTSEESTYALWRLFERGIIADEYKDVQMLALHGFPQAVLHSKTPIRRIEDVKGLKIRISSKVLADVATSLNATPVSLSSVQAYQHLSRGVVDADLVQWTAVCFAKINEATSHHFEGVFGGQGAMIVMNKAAWDKLPQAGKEALRKHSGVELAAQLGRLQDRIHTECREQTSKMPGHHITAPSGADAQAWRQAIQPAVKAWLDTTPGGQDILNAYREEVAAYRKRR